jgi:hypothetical protein
MLDIKRRYRLRLGVLTLRDGECGAPLVPQDVQTNAAVRVDVGVVDAGSEVDLGRLEGVVCGEMDCEEEDTARVWGITLYKMRQSGDVLENRVRV